MTYLWVDLVYKTLEKVVERGIPKKEWRDLAVSFPSTIDSIYNKVLSDAKDPQETRNLLHIILAARSPLTWKEVDMALEVRRRTGCEYLDDYSLESSKDAFESRIRASVGFFVAIHNDKLYVIHQTAREFLLQPDPAPFFTGFAQLDVGLSIMCEWALDGAVAISPELSGSIRLHRY